MEEQRDGVELLSPAKKHAHKLHSMLCAARECTWSFEEGGLRGNRPKWSVENEHGKFLRLANEFQSFIGKEITFANIDIIISLILSAR